MADVFALVVGEFGPGFIGNGGGARSGSALSHLRLSCCQHSHFDAGMAVMPCRCDSRRRSTHMGTLARPLASDQECLWLLIGRSREASLETEDMVMDGGDEPWNGWDANAGMHP